MLLRNLASSKLKSRILSLSSLRNTWYSLQLSHLSSLIDSSTKPYQNPAKPFLFIFSSSNFRQFCAQPSSSIPSLPLARDGNYDETASQDLHICSGCGVHMQSSCPKHPGYFTKPSQKNPNNLSRRNETRFVAEEPEFLDSIKRGCLILEPESSEFDGDLIQYPEKPVVCARCHSLRHYGKVKDPTVENLLPDFDFDHTVGKKLTSAKGTRSVVLMVADASDFDGSFPRKVAKLVSNTLLEYSRAWKEGKSGNIPRVVLVVTKIDLLPPSLSPTRFEHWVRQRARDGGASKVTSVHLVSALRDWGLKNLFDDIVALAGPRGNVWAIGAQNAGKSTLINSLAKRVGGRVTHLTEAPVPGTTLGIVRVEGVLPGHAKLFDTPGLLHPHQISTRLTLEEQKLVQIRKELSPRTYRIKAGHTVHIAGLMRLDIEKSSVDTIYVTVWASPYLPLHMGKTANSCKMLEDHFGRQLQPPFGEKRVEELGKWERREFSVSGNSWDSSSVDLAAAGLGWFAIGLKGEAVVGLWTYDGVDVVLRNSLIPYRSQYFEVAGFTVSEIVSKADQASNKSQRQTGKKRKPSDPKARDPAEPITIIS